MFPRGPRFQPPKVSDVPGPGTYNPEQESLDNYKRGAFLETTDRFAKDKQPEPPMPNLKPTDTTQRKPSQSPNHAERYAALQRKVEDLEKVHQEGKKTHKAELERIKQDLTHAQKLAADNADQAEKQKKQNAVLETRLQDLKRATASDQGELKDLRHKLRSMELEREKVSTKHSELVELRRSLHTAELKRKDDLKERDRRIAELEKALVLEQKAAQETKNAKQAVEREAQATQAIVLEMEALRQQAQTDSQLARANARRLEESSARREDELVNQLEQHRTLLDRVAQQYAHLASLTVPIAQHRGLKHDHAVLRLRQLRLERKLANSEGQVVELTHLIRQVKQENLLLGRQLSDALSEISFLSSIEPNPNDNVPLDDTAAILDRATHDLTEGRAQLAESKAATYKMTSDYYHLKSNDLCSHFFVLDKELLSTQAIAEQHASDLSSALASHEAIAARLEEVQKERAVREEEAKTASEEMSALRTSTAILESHILDLKEIISGSAAKHTAALKKEKDVVQRLSTTIQKSRMAEDALRAEIDALTVELTDAERFQEAYYSLSDEVGALLTRNQIAEEEADRISKFNAEILGHNNPAQRIMYVDRIRRELAEAKHKIAMMANEQENIAAQNTNLQHELDMYTSVTVPLETKPRTNIIRVGRPPLVNLGHSLNAGLSVNGARSGMSVVKSISPAHEPLLEINENDMTMDELM
ncbi:hypothetical protein B0H34DRAFT_857540 [Crassisporium funariophilum]|nr:hypothetical protein B0H34DRAFT_857540 [Crassisporium funariophilum]